LHTAISFSSVFIRISDFFLCGFLYVCYVNYVHNSLALLNGQVLYMRTFFPIDSMLSPFLFTLLNPVSDEQHLNAPQNLTS